MGDHETKAGLFGLAVAGLAACCGLPLLASLGALRALAGLGIGNWLLIGAGMFAGGVGAWRWRRSRATCETSTATVPDSGLYRPEGALRDER